MGKRTYSDDDIESIIKEYVPKSEDVDLVIEGLHTRLQRAEEQIRQVRELADYLQVARDEGKIQRDDPWKPDSVIKQLRAIVDTGRGEGGEG